MYFKDSWDTSGSLKGSLIFSKRILFWVDLLLGGVLIRVRGRGLLFFIFLRRGSWQGDLSRGLPLYYLKNKLISIYYLFQVPIGRRVNMEFSHTTLALPVGTSSTIAWTPRTRVIGTKPTD